MAFQNRVDPFGAVAAVPQRGRWMGNRGILHTGTSIVRPWQHPHWIICALSYKDWRAAQWAASRYTPLFFLDEAVALAAGHRPCALCRRPRWNAFVQAWADATGDPRPMRDAIDRRLDAERRDRRSQRTHVRPWSALPNGVYAVVDGVPVCIRDDALVPWTADGYGAPVVRPRRGAATVLTPAITVDVIAAGYLPDL